MKKMAIWQKAKKILKGQFKREIENVNYMI